MKVEYFDLNEDTGTIRGIFCVKKKLEMDIDVFICNKIVTDPFFFWEPACSGSVFEKGLELVRRGLGFPKEDRKGPTLEKMITKVKK